MHLSFSHIFSWLYSSFLFSTEWYSIVWMYHSLFIHSPTEGHLFFLKDSFFFLKGFYLFIFRERGREGEWETKTCGCLSHAPYPGPSPQTRHVPWLGIKPATLWFAGLCSTHWATPARAEGHLGCFHVWAILNKAAIIISVQVFCVYLSVRLLRVNTKEQVYWIISEKYLVL